LTQTVTVSPSLTTSATLLTRSGLSAEICTRPSRPTPTSTKAPNNSIFLTVPVKAILTVPVKAIFGLRSSRRLGAAVCVSVTGTSSSYKSPRDAEKFFVGRTSSLARQEQIVRRRARSF